MPTTLKRKVARKSASVSLPERAKHGDKDVTNTFTATYEETEDGWWIATLLEIPGVFSQGRTLEEAREYLQDAAMLMMEEYRADSRKEMSQSAVVEEIAVPLP